jgi:hypothetical protein
VHNPPGGKSSITFGWLMIDLSAFFKLFLDWSDSIQLQPNPHLSTYSAASPRTGG